VGRVSSEGAEVVSHRTRPSRMLAEGGVSMFLSMFTCVSMVKTADLFH